MTMTIDEHIIDRSAHYLRTVGEIPKKKYIVGIDDVIYCFKNITLTAPASIWEDPFLAYLKSCHETYGTSFSCFCFYQGVVGYPHQDTSNFDLSMMPSTYVEEFKSASSWLKWGFHAKSNDSAYANVTEDPYADAIAVYNQLYRIVGTESLTGLIRMHRYMGNAQTISKLKDLGIWGIIGVDPLIRDTYLSYHLTKVQSDILYESGLHLDPISGLAIMAGDGVVERMTPVSGGEAGYAGTHADMGKYLAHYTSTRPRQQNIHISSHETWLQYTDYKNSLKAGLQWLMDNDWQSEYLGQEDVFNTDRIVGNKYYSKPYLVSSRNDTPVFSYPVGVSPTNYQASYADPLDRGGSRTLLLTAGAKAVWTFTGCYFKFIAQKSNARGIIGVQIDSQFEFLLDQYDANLEYQVLQYETFLTQGVHTLTFRCINQKNALSSGVAVTIDSIDTFSLVDHVEGL